MNSNQCTVGLICAALTFVSIAESQLVPSEGGKRTGGMDDLSEMISEINTDIEQYRLQQGWDTALTESQLEQARSQAFLDWCREHHADNFGAGPKFADIKNMEVPSNLGVLDLDWLATLGNTGVFARGPLGDLTYLAGKEAWFSARAEKPDRSTFASTYPDSNWHALVAADLLLSGKVSIEEILLPDHNSQMVRDKSVELQLQRKINDSLPFLSSKKNDNGLGGVTLEEKAGPGSFRPVKERPLDSYLCVSLSAITHSASEQLAGRGVLSEPVAWLGGIASVDALIPTHEGLIVVGKASTRPAMRATHLDDVAALLRAVGPEAPYCSLDPKPQNVIKLNQLLAAEPSEENIKSGAFLKSVREAVGPQTIRVGNINPTSRLAHEIITADYNLKQYDQGLLTAPGLITSCLDLCVASMRQATAAGRSASAPFSGTARVWICFDRAHQPVFGTNSSGMIWLEDCPIAVRVERQLSTPSGELVDANTPPDPEATAFCREFSENLSKIGELDNAIGTCVNIFRWQALLNAADYLGLLHGPEIEYLQNHYRMQMNTEMSTELPGLANGKFVQWSDASMKGVVTTFKLFPIVCGGVDLKIQIAPEQFKSATRDHTQICSMVLVSRHEPTEICWQAPKF